MKFQITRPDVSPFARRLARRMHDAAEHKARVLEHEDKKWKYDVTETLYYLAERDEKTGEWSAKLVTGTDLDVSVKAPREQSIVFELRWAYAQALADARRVKDFDEAKARAAKATYLCAERIAG